MKIKFKQLMQAVDFLRFNTSISAEVSEIEVNISEENLDEGIITSIFSISVDDVKPVDKWSRYLGERKIKSTMEIFSSYENRKMVCTTQEVQELIEKDD